MDCAGKANNSLTQDCFSSYSCIDGERSAITKCNGSLPWFDPDNSTCSATVPSGCDADCLGKSDREKTADGCFSYYECKAGEKTEKNCNNKFFHPENGTCSNTAPTGCDAECLGKNDGERTKINCFSYYECNNGVKTEENCTNQFFYPGNSSCSDAVPSGCDADCLGKSNREKTADGCSAYYECDDGVKTEKNCTNQYFDPLSNSCSGTAPSGCVSVHADCVGKSNGTRTADGCFAYYECNGGIKTEFNCTNQFFYPGNSSCSDAAPSGCDADCLDKSDGEKTADGCFSYYVCNAGEKTEFNCTNQFFYPGNSSCSAAVPSGCNADCLGKSDGERTADGCFEYYECHAGVKTNKICPGSEWFETQNNTCSLVAPPGCARK